MGDGGHDDQRRTYSRPYQGGHNSSEPRRLGVREPAEVAEPDEGGGGEEVAAALPPPPPPGAEQAPIGSVDQGGGLEGLPRPLAGELVRGRAAELVVDQRQELGGPVAKGRNAPFKQSRYPNRGLPQNHSNSPRGDRFLRFLHARARPR